MSDSKKIKLAKKLKELSDRGIDGEKVNAKIKLEEYMVKHGITDEMLEKEDLEDHIFMFKREHELFIDQIIFYVLDVSNIQMLYQDAERHMYVKIKCSQAQAIEIHLMKDFYTPIIEREIDKFLIGFCVANKIFSKKQAGGNEKNTGEVDKDFVSGVLKYSKQAPVVVMHKQLATKRPQTLNGKIKKAE